MIGGPHPMPADIELNVRILDHLISAPEWRLRETSRRICPRQWADPIHLRLQKIRRSPKRRRVISQADPPTAKASISLGPNPSEIPSIGDKLKEYEAFDGGRSIHAIVNSNCGSDRCTRLAAGISRRPRMWLRGGDDEREALDTVRRWRSERAALRRCQNRRRSGELSRDDPIARTRRQIYRQVSCAVEANSVGVAGIPWVHGAGFERTLGAGASLQRASRRAQKRQVSWR